jgi:hypothetical protein
VLGLVGKFWRADGNIQRVTRDEFIAFTAPGYARGVINFRLSEARSGTTLSTETRVRCIDAAGRTRFRPYWTLTSPFGALIRREMLRLVKREAER